jgi:hexosaminidase
MEPAGAERSARDPTEGIRRTTSGGGPSAEQHFAFHGECWEPQGFVVEAVKSAHCNAEQSGPRLWPVGPMREWSSKFDLRARQRAEVDPWLELQSHHPALEPLHAKGGDLEVECVTGRGRGVFDAYRATAVDVPVVALSACCRRESGEHRDENERGTHGANTSPRTVAEKNTRARDVAERIGAQKDDVDSSLSLATGRPRRDFARIHTGSLMPSLRLSFLSRRVFLPALALAACARPSATRPGPEARALPHAVIPIPASIQITPGSFFTIDTTTSVVIAAGASDEVERIGAILAGLVTLNTPFSDPGTPRMTGRKIPRARRLGADEPGPSNSLFLSLDPSRSALGVEGYELSITTTQVTLVARDANGLFYGVQTIRQLLPWSVEHGAGINRAMRLPVARITDTPRFSWRGTMLDVSRHFLGHDDVKRYIDHLALYKINRLHLHLADDQGWRIEVKSWPNLANFGGVTEVGGGVGGFYTQEQFADIVAHARSRFIEIIPEIDMPAHTNAALSAYPELNCNDVAPPPYTGIDVGFSALCVDREVTYRFIDDVIREIGALVPSPWFHIGGDEVEKLTHAQYARFIERVQGMVMARGKTMIGWSEIASTNLHPSSIVQHWVNDSAHNHVARGGKVIISRGNNLYIDMKYDSSTVLGLMWAGLIDVQKAYDWEPATLRPGVPESGIIGIEAPLWSETVEKLQDFEFMAFPRLTAVAELGWSTPAQRGWDGFRNRLAAHGPRLQAMGVNFYRSPQIPWRLR